MDVGLHLIPITTAKIHIMGEIHMLTRIQKLEMFIEAILFSQPQVSPDVSSERATFAVSRLG